MQSLPRKFLKLAFVIFVLSLPIFSQRGGKGGGPPKGGGSGNVPAPGVPAGSAPGSPNFSPGTPYPGFCADTLGCPPVNPRPPSVSPTQDSPTCFLPPVDGIHSSTVSVGRLEVPGKAEHEYHSACSALQHKKYASAEEHLNRAIDVYPAYTAAWVLLGQVQELERKKDNATESCSRAMRIDSTYPSSYLCLAHLMTAKEDWAEVEDLTNRLLQLHPVNASNAYYYNALAYFHLNQLSSAETSALRGVEDTRQLHQPRLHLLLARIYEKKGDRSQEIAQLREFLKRAPHSEDATQASNALKAIIKENTASLLP